MELNVVVARYKESVGWVGGLNYPCLIFNKNRNEDHLFQHNLPNCGMDADTFFRYIIENYETLPDYVAFLQGNPFDHCASTVEKINNFSFDRSFEPIGCAYGSENDHVLKSTLDWASYCGIEILSPVKFISGMQCIVSKNLIRMRSEESYRKIYAKISKRIDYNCRSGRYFEYLWPTILGFNNIVDVGGRY